MVVVVVMMVVILSRFSSGTNNRQLLSKITGRVYYCPLRFLEINWFGRGGRLL